MPPSRRRSAPRPRLRRLVRGAGPALSLLATLLAWPAAPALADGKDGPSAGPNIVNESDRISDDVLPGAPPAGRFEEGGGAIREVRMDPKAPERYLGVWSGPLAPINMRYFEVEGPPVGDAVLTIMDVKGNLASGIIRWNAPEVDPAPQRWLGAFTLSGHIMVLNAHAILYQQDHRRYIEADMMLPSGKYYRLRLSRVE